jgi:hypothetical protein
VISRCVFLADSASGGILFKRTAIGNLDVATLDFFPSEFIARRATKATTGQVNYHGRHGVEMAERSAEDIQPRAQLALAGSPICELRELRVEPLDGGLVLSGAVSSFYHKQLAQEAVRALCNGEDIDLVNAIRVHGNQVQDFP